MNKKHCTLILVTIICMGVAVKTGIAESAAGTGKWSIELTKGSWAYKAYQEGGVSLLCEELSSTFLLDDENDEKFNLAFCYYSGTSVKQDWNASIAILKTLSLKAYPNAEQLINKLRSTAKKSSGPVETEKGTASASIQRSMLGVELGQSENEALSAAFEASCDTPTRVERTCWFPDGNSGFSFEGGHIVSIFASKDFASLSKVEELINNTKSKFGSPKVRESKIMSLRTVTYKWNDDATILEYVVSTGRDISGKPIKGIMTTIKDIGHRR